MRKSYGQSKIATCPFCGKNALSKNKEGIPVCIDHKTETLPDLKCICGEYLDLRFSKFGPFFTCMNCGTVSFAKAMDMNPPIKPKNKVIPKEDKPKPKTTEFQKFSSEGETMITSDDVDLFYS